MEVPVILSLLACELQAPTRAHADEPPPTIQCVARRVLRITDEPIGMSGDVRGASPCVWTDPETGDELYDPTCCPTGWTSVGLDGTAVVCVED